MRAALVLLLTAWTSVAQAGGVGVVVTGDATLQPQLTAQLEGWLRQHGHELVASPLPPDAVNSLIDCFVIEDPACARGVVEKRAKTTTVVFARVDVSDNATSGMRDVTITAYWFDKGHEPIAERRSCEHCTDEMVRTETDGLMMALAGNQRDAGRLAVTAAPAGATVLVDGKVVGAAPVEVPLAAGDHQVTCRHAGHRDDLRTVTIKVGETTPLAVVLVSAAAPRSKLPYYVIGAGGALLLTGLVLYATSEEDTGATFEYRDTKPLGIGVSLVGLAVGGLGGYLWFKRAPAESAPALALTRGGAYVGWSRAF